MKPLQTVSLVSGLNFHQLSVHIIICQEGKLTLSAGLEVEVRRCIIRLRHYNKLTVEGYAEGNFPGRHFLSRMISFKIRAVYMLKKIHVFGNKYPSVSPTPSTSSVIPSLCRTREEPPRRRAPTRRGRPAPPPPPSPSSMRTHRR